MIRSPSAPGTRAVLRPALPRGRVDAVLRLEPGAEAVLRGMTEYVFGVRQSGVTTENALEVVPPGGQSIQFSVQHGETPFPRRPSQGHRSPPSGACRGTHSLMRQPHADRCSAAIDHGRRIPRHHRLAVDVPLGGWGGAAHDPPCGRVRRRGERCDIGDRAAASSHRPATVGHGPTTVRHGAATGSRGSAIGRRCSDASGTGASRIAADAPAVGSITHALPAGCVPEARAVVEYQRRGNVCYRATFQGNKLVFAVQWPWRLAAGSLQRNRR